jgi:ATP phosphoribosyltransferase
VLAGCGLHGRLDEVSELLCSSWRRLRVATKYLNLTRRFFAEKKGVTGYRIVESLGGREAPPPAAVWDMQLRFNPCRQSPQGS